MLALGERLVQRGHAVAMQTWKRWEDDVQGAGMHFVRAPEYQVFPTLERPLKPYEAAVRVAPGEAEAMRAFAADAVVADILTVGTRLAADMAGLPCATLVPHVYPHGGDGHPAYSIGARLPRTRAGRRLWRGVYRRLIEPSLLTGRDEYNESRRRLGLEPQPYVHTALSRQLTLVGTLPQLEYPRDWEPWQRIVGPMMWEPPGDRVDPPAGDAPVVLVAPSTSQDPEHRLLRAALDGLGGSPVRVIATWNGREPPFDVSRVASNIVVVPWVSYSQTMPACDVVVSHGGHGTLMRALSSGCRCVVTPAAGDMNENAARIDWAGLGVRIPRRYVSAGTVRLAVERVLADERIGLRCAAAARWSAAHDGPSRASAAIERWISSPPSGGA